MGQEVGKGGADHKRGGGLPGTVEGKIWGAVIAARCSGQWPQQSAVPTPVTVGVQGVHLLRWPGGEQCCCPGPHCASPRHPVCLNIGHQTHISPHRLDTPCALRCSQHPQSAPHLPPPPQKPPYPLPRPSDPNSPNNKHPHSPNHPWSHPHIQMIPQWTATQSTQRIRNRTLQHTLQQPQYC